jgi:hypothetical protein
MKLTEADLVPIAPIWIVMPVLAQPDYTTAAIADVLAQSVPVRLLIINQGVDEPFRALLEAIAEEYPGAVLLWNHQPPLPSLSATWNRALQFVWEAGGEEALVVNNDVRLHRETVAVLSLIRARYAALFVSAVGVTSAQFDPAGPTLDPEVTGVEKGGPDFSCFLISRVCHDRFPFDERFIPAFCEDLDYHRRLLLAGEGARIFSVNLPYLHYGSATIKTLDAPARMKLDRAIELGSRAYYAKKWGGPVNQETYLSPFNAPLDGGTFAAMLSQRVGPAESLKGPTTPELQEWCNG